MINSIIKNKKGESFIDITIYILVITIAITLIINVVPILIVKININEMNEKIVRYVETTGRTDTAEINNYINKLKDKYNLDVSVSFSKNGKINLNEEFEVYVSATKEFKLLLNITHTFEIKSVRVGRSEVFFK